MDANSKHQAPKGGEISTTEKQTAEGGSEVVAPIPSESKVSSPLTMSSIGTTKPLPLNHGSYEKGSIPSPNMSPVVSTPNQTALFRRRSPYSERKPRFAEPLYDITEAIPEENSTSTLQEELNDSSPCRNCYDASSPIDKSGTVKGMASNTLKTPSSNILKTLLMACPLLAGEDEDEIIHKVVLSKGKCKRLTTKVLIEWFLFLCIVGSLLASSTVDKLNEKRIWGLGLWKCCVLLMVAFCGMKGTEWFMCIIAFLIEKNFLLRRKVLYFVHGPKKCVQVFIWLGLVLLTWVLLINNGVPRSQLATKVLDGVTGTLISLLIGAFVLLLKMLLLKILASNFYVKYFFDRIHESIFHQYVFQTLSGPPLIGEAAKVGESISTGQLSFRSTKGKGGTKEEVIDMAKFLKMKREKVSACTIKTLINAVKNSRLSTTSRSLDGSFDDGKEITNAMEATAAAYHIFRNVASPGCMYIDGHELERFMSKEELKLVFPLLAQAGTRQITRKSLADWVRKVYKERKALGYALSDTKTAVRQLDKLVTGILVVVAIIVWLLLMAWLLWMDVATKVLVFLASQLVLATFMFGNTCKNIFQAIIFVFVMHPFDVGDRCVVDGVELLVEEMNLLTTVFLKPNNTKLYSPNSVLATKVIRNYYRSRDTGDVAEFTVDFKTPEEKNTTALKEKIKRYLEANTQYWHPNHNFAVKETENVNRFEKFLYVYPDNELSRI